MPPWHDLTGPAPSLPQCDTQQYWPAAGGHPQTQCSPLLPQFLCSTCHKPSPRPHPHTWVPHVCRPKPPSWAGMGLSGESTARHARGSGFKPPPPVLQKEGQQNSRTTTLRHSEGPQEASRRRPPREDPPCGTAAVLAERLSCLRSCPGTCPCNVLAEALAFI